MWDDVEDETPAAPVEEPAPEAAAAEGAAASAAAEAKPEVAETPVPESPLAAAEPKKLVFKHWARPRTNQYNYISNYRQNYYSDLITYLDKRNLGVPVERPQALTWGERALKSYLSNIPKSYSERMHNKDTALLRHISTGARFHRYHTKSLISRKYSSLGFNTDFVGVATLAAYWITSEPVRIP